MGDSLNIAVVGAGVIGLTTAIELKKELRNSNVTIFADKFTTETTSHVAAGLFRPGTSFCGPTEEITRYVLHLNTLKAGALFTRRLRSVAY